MYFNFYIRSILFIIVVLATTQIKGQSLSSLIRDEMKKDLLKRVNPSMSVSGSAMKQSPITISGGVNNDNLLEYSKKYRKGSGGEEFDSPYKVNPYAITYSSNIPINQIKPGTVVPVYTGGHFVLVNPATNSLGLVTPSGLNLSGGEKKKITERTRQLLALLFGIKVDEYGAEE